MFTGKLLTADFLEGMIRPVTREAVKSFKEYTAILKNRGEFLKKDNEKNGRNQ